MFGEWQHALANVLRHMRAHLAVEGRNTTYLSVSEYWYPPAPNNGKSIGLVLTNDNYFTLKLAKHGCQEIVLRSQPMEIKSGVSATTLWV